VQEHRGDILTARATGLTEGLAKGFVMEGERRKKQYDEEKEGSQESMEVAYCQPNKNDESLGKQFGRFEVAGGGSGEGAGVFENTPRSQVRGPPNTHVPSPGFCRHSAPMWPHMVRRS